MAISEESAAVAAATLTAAVVTASGGVQGGMTRDEAIGHVMDTYRRSLNVVRNASDPQKPRKV